MIDHMNPSTRFMVLRGGCFGSAFATVAFTPASVTPDQAQQAMAQSYPDLFQSYDCELCGVDIPSFSENYNVNEEEIHRHSPESCGHEPNFMERERLHRALDYSMALTASEYMDSLTPEEAEDAPHGDEDALESWIADRENCFPSDHCDYDITYSLSEILMLSDACTTDFYCLEREGSGFISIQMVYPSPLAELRS